MQVAQIMNPSVVTVEPRDTAALAARLISRHNVGLLPVCAADGRLLGVVTDRDIVLRCVAARSDPEETPVSDIMSQGCVWVDAREDCRSAARLMALHQIRRLPVQQGGKLVGMLSLGDLARTRSLDMEAAQALQGVSRQVVRPGEG